MTAVIMSGRLQLVASLAKFVHCGPNVWVPLLGCSTLRQLYDTDGLPTVILQNPEWSAVGKIHFSPPPTGGSPLRQFKRTAVTLPARGKSRAGWMPATPWLATCWAMNVAEAGSPAHAALIEAPHCNRINFPTW